MCAVGPSGAVCPASGRRIALERTGAARMRAAAASQSAGRERPADAQSWPLMSRPAKKANQGLAEYVLLLALVIFAATVGIESLASAVNSAFGKVGEILGRYLS